MGHGGWWVSAQGSKPEPRGCRGLCRDGRYAGLAALCCAGALLWLGWSREPPLPVSWFLPPSDEGGCAVLVASQEQPRWVVLLCRESSLKMPGWQDSHSQVHPCCCSPVTSKILSSTGPEILPRLLLHAVLGIKVSSKAVSGSAPGLFIS